MLEFLFFSFWLSACHLPLGTATYDAIELSKLIAQETAVLVAPAVFAGTVTLWTPTLEAAVKFIEAWKKISQ